MTNSLADLQKYVADTAKARGFDDESVAQKFMLLAEEIGELARAARRVTGIKSADDTARANLEEEAADVLYVFMNTCNKLDIALDEAFATKEAKNNKRSWS